VELGQRVALGQELARLDERDLELAVLNAQAQLDAARTQRDLASSEFKRFENLKNQQFISEAELERRSTTLKAAQAQLDQATAQLRLQRNQREDTRLFANAKGVVTAIEAEVGQVVAAGQTVVRLAHEGPREVAVSVPEQQLKRMAVGQSMKVKVHATGETGLARVRDIAAAADPATRTFEVRLALEAGFQPPLGSSVQVTLAAQGKPSDALSVPATAVIRKGQSSVVWVLDASSMTVRAQPVQVGDLVGERMVITQGLQAGQTIVAAGAHVLTEGQRVVRFEAKP
jgi:RND family efflux transporter MFP subunit